MQEKRVVRVPAHNEEQVVRTACDLCGKGVETSEYDIDEVIISHNTGRSYPEGGDRKEEMVDVCPECWKIRVVPWLQAQGAVLRIENHDWW